MKPSKFLLLAPLPDGTVAVRHTMQGGVIAVKTAAALALQRGELSGFSVEETELLESNSFLLHDDVDENRVFLDAYRDTWGASDIFILHLMPTMNCQLACPYCYEDGICRRKFMNQNVERQLYDWVTQYLADHQLSTLRVVWFGGEPLLRTKQIEKMLPRLCSIANGAGIKFETQMVTNGVLLSEDILVALASHNLQRLQITLDGPPEVHDRRRYFKGSQAGTFAQIYDNILYSLHGYIEQVDVRINLDRDNLASAGDLLRLMAADNIQDKVKLSIGIITGTIPNEECGGANSYSQQHGFSEDEAITAYLEVAKLAKENGFQIPETMAVGPWCIARHPNAWMVGPEGEIYRCLSMVGREEGILGHLPDVPSNEVNAIETLERMRQCLDKNCPLVPLCGGGCLFENHVNGQTCPEKLLTAINQGLISLQYG